MWFLTSAAWACGGMVCDPGPLESLVIQNAERIAFHIDEDAGMVEAHVQIFYEGPPDQFGWVVPVSAQPEVFVSTDALFDRLARDLAPQVRLDFATEGDCGGRASGCVGKSGDSAERDFPFVDSGMRFDTADVILVDEGQVGPYDYAILQATSAGVLTTWMQDAGYAIPDGLDAVLQPYIGPDAHFLAVRLSKNRSTGDIAPLGWRYAGDEASIPIQLTAIAAAPDLRLEVSVFGGTRAVPESYLHVTINEANLDWWNGGSNYYDVVSRAADQAGGHAFSTDYAGTTTALQGTLWPGDRASLAAGLDTTDPLAFASTWNSLRIAANSNVMFALGLHVADPSLDGFLTASELEGVDLVALRDDLDAYVFQPLARAEALFTAPWVTRMSSSLDADEMTIDPTFVLNGDVVQTVSNLHQARLVTECRGGDGFRSPRRLELVDGRVYRMPAQSEVGSTDSEWWLANASDVEAIRIERTGKNGLPEVVADNTEASWEDVGASGQGCGCTPRSAPFAGSLVGLLGLVLMRRDRR